MKLSTSTYDFLSISDNIVDHILCYENTGFRYLNLAMEFEAKPDKPLGQDGEAWYRMFDNIGEAAAKMGLVLIMAHAPGEAILHGVDRDMYIRAVNRCIEGCALLGIKDLVIHPAWNKDFFYKEYLFKENIEFFSLVLPTAEKFSINILVENNFYTNGVLNNGSDMLELCKAINHPLFYVCWDTGHARLANVDQYESITFLGKKLRGLHIQDNEGYSDRHTGPFMGDINFDPIMQALIDINYGGYFNFESVFILKPNHRNPWVYHGLPVNRLTVPPKHLIQMAVRFLHEIGVYLLSSYGVYEI